MFCLGFQSIARFINMNASWRVNGYVPRNNSFSKINELDRAFYHVHFQKTLLLKYKGLLANYMLLDLSVMN